jgi:CHAT domain-containing protein
MRILFNLLIFTILCFCAKAQVGTNPFDLDAIYKHVNSLKTQNEQLTYADEVLKRTEKEKTIDSQEYHRALELIIYLKNLYGYNTLAYRETKLKISDRLFGKNSTESAINKSAIVSIKLSMESKPDNIVLNECLRLLKECEVTFEIASKTDTSYIVSLASIYGNYRNIYRWTNEITKQVEFLDKSIMLLEKHNKIQSPLYASYIISISQIFTNKFQKPKDALVFLQKKIELVSRKIGIESSSSLEILKEKINIYGRPDVDVDVVDGVDIDQAMNIIKKKYGRNSKELADFKLYYEVRINKKENFLYGMEENLNTIFSLYEINQNQVSYQDWFEWSINMSELYQMKHNFNKQYFHLNQSLYILHKFYKNDSSKDLLGARTVYSKMADYFINKNIDSCHYYYKKSIEIEERMSEFGFTVTNLYHYADFLASIGDLSNAEIYYKRQIDIFEKKGETKSGFYFRCLFGLGELFYKKGDRKKGLELMTHHVNYDLEKLATPEIGSSTFTIYADYMEKEQKYEEANMYYAVHYDRVIDLLKSEIMANEGGAHVLNDWYIINRHILSNIALRDDNKCLPIELTSFLFSKRLYFDYEEGVSLVLEKKPVIKKKYDHYIGLKNQVERFYQTPNLSTKKQKELDSLIYISNTLKRRLEYDLISSQDQTLLERLKIIFSDDISQTLKKDEAFVRIISYNQELQKNNKLPKTRYAFEVITSETKKESCILFQTPEFNDKMYIDLWKPIENAIKDKKRIYISPDGIYNTINIGAIVQPNGRLLMEDYDIRIVTSARDLIEQKEKKNYENTAVLVGNPTFNLAAPKQTALAANYTRSYTETPLFAWPTLTRGSIAPLPNTKAEVENIGKILQAKGFKTQTLLGDQALEEAVKAVKSPRILHIATHGFFEADVTKKDSLQADDFMGIQRAKAAENPLLRSGLLLAGAENYLKTKKLSNDHENGILTAYEAMNLDLENTELVVLSACETGLGEIKNGEGVYGLQRALRIAGAQSVLMSLAKVPDATTKILMEAFYENWLTKGMNKHEALKQAQLTVRKMPQYAAPVNWAAFVLVE